MLIIYTDKTEVPNRTYVNGWHNDSLFEFDYLYQNNSYVFGTTPWMFDGYARGQALCVDEQAEIVSTWIKGQYKSYYDLSEHEQERLRSGLCGKGVYFHELL